MVAGTNPTPDTQTVTVQLDRTIADQAEAIARENNFSSLSHALAAVTKRIAINRRMPFENSRDNTHGDPAERTYAGVSLSRLGELARQSGADAVAQARAAGKPVSYATEDGRIVEEVDGKVREIGRVR